MLVLLRRTSFFRAELAAPYTFSAGAESLEVALFEPDSIPFDKVRHIGWSTAVHTPTEAPAAGYTLAVLTECCHLVKVWVMSLQCQQGKGPGCAAKQCVDRQGQASQAAAAAVGGCGRTHV